jgi:sugar phosphate permease
MSNSKDSAVVTVDKGSASELENAHNLRQEELKAQGLSDSHESHPDQLASFDRVEVHKITRIIDTRLVPVVTIMYAISLMDRTNLGNLAIAGMSKDLNILTGYGYNLSNMTFFITYILFQPLLVLVCRKMGPRWFLPMITALWGIVLISAGWIQHWHSLLAVRLVLGFLEAGFFPSCLYLLSTWYTRCKFSLQPCTFGY